MIMKSNKNQINDFTRTRKNRRGRSLGKERWVLFIRRGEAGTVFGTRKAVSEVAGRGGSGVW